MDRFKTTLAYTYEIPTGGIRRVIVLLLQGVGWATTGGYNPLLIELTSTLQLTGGQSWVGDVVSASLNCIVNRKGSAVVPLPEANVSAHPVSACVVSAVARSQEYMDVIPSDFESSRNSMIKTLVLES
jgi:hypothetical protein